MKTLTLTVSAALAAALLAGPATAADDDTIRSVEVRYGDLNLSTAEGMDAFDRRLDRAAKSVCRVNELSMGTSIVARESRACYKKTLESMESRVAAVVAKQARG